MPSMTSLSSALYFESVTMPRVGILRILPLLVLALGSVEFIAHVSYGLLVVIRGLGRYSSCTVDGEVDRRELVAGSNTTRR